MAYFFGKGAGVPVTDFRNTQQQPDQQQAQPGQAQARPPAVADPGAAPAQTAATVAGDQGGTILIPPDQQCPEGYRDGGIVPDVGGEGTCKADCRREYNLCLREQRRAGQGRTGECRERFEACLENCKGQPGEEKRRCIKIDPDDPPIDPPGEGCEGGYKLADQPVTGGGGQLWTDTVLNEGHGWYRDSRAEGHYVWHPDWGYQLITDVHNFVQGSGNLVKNAVGACRKGFKKTGDMCCPGQDDGGGTGLGQFRFPERLQNLMQLLLGRGEEFLTREPGFSEEAMSNIFGRNFETIRGLGDVTREQQLRGLGSQGLRGTPAEFGVARQTAEGTETNVSNIVRDLFLLNEQQKRSDLLDFTSAGQNILGAGTGFFGTEEQFNVGRRGEQYQNFALLLQYLMSLMSSWR